MLTWRNATGNLGKLLNAMDDDDGHHDDIEYKYENTMMKSS